MATYCGLIFFCDTVIDKSYHLKRVKIPLLSYWYGIMAEDCCCQHSGRRQTRSFSKAWRWKSWRSAQHWLGWEARKTHQHTYFGGQFSNGIYQNQGCQQHFFLMTLSLGQARRLIMWWIAFCTQTLWKHLPSLSLPFLPNHGLKNTSKYHKCWILPLHK